MGSGNKSKNDVDLLKETGAGQEEVTSLHVTDLLEELIEDADCKWAEVWEDAIKHERAYHSFNTSADRDREGPRSGQATKNLIRLLVSGYNSRLVQDHVRNRAYPAHPQAGDIKAAELANAYLDWWTRDQKFGVRDYEFGQNGQLHGTAFWKIHWDPNGGDKLVEGAVDEDGAPAIDPETGLQEFEDVGFVGSVEAEVVTLFEACFGPGHEIDTAEWCLFRKFVSKDVALGMLDDAGLSAGLLGEPRDYQTVTDGVAKGWEIWEVWYKPGRRFPKGLYTQVLGRSAVLNTSSFPYDHGQLPLAVWHPDFVTNRPFGTSHVFDNYPLQLKLNLAEQKKDELMNRMAGVLMLAPEDLKDEIEEGNLIVGITNPQQANMVQFKSIERIPSLILDRAAELQRDMFDIGGQNEILAGFESLKAGTSAKSYEFLSRSDKAKMAAAIARYRGCAFRRDQQALRLFQQYATSERKILVMGPDSTPYVELFSGTMLDGTDVVFEQAPLADTLRSTKAGAAPESAKLGLIPQSQVQETAQTGLMSTLVEAQGRERLQMLLKAAVLEGNTEAQPDPTVPPSVALEEIAAFEALDQGGNRSVLVSFAKFYKDLAAQLQQPQPAPGGSNVPR